MSPSEPKAGPNPGGENPVAETSSKKPEAVSADPIRELAEYKDRYVRLFAEFENARKRFERDKQEFVKYANEGLIVDFLGVLDDLERSVEAATARHEDYAAFLKGVEMVMARLYDLLRRNNVKPMDPVGKPFDPHCHEILMQAPSPGHDEGTVTEQFQKGYFLGDKVIRTAKVKVAVASPSEESGCDVQSGDRG